MKIKAIITGATGMVGEGVLHECLHDPNVEEILVIGRRSCGYAHPKLREIIHYDFFNIEPIKAQLKGYNACYFCLGVSSVGMKEPKFTHLTYDLTLGFAQTLVEVSPKLTFCYVSGSGTDSSENGKVMWARVKGKTENDLLSLGFKAAYMFRPGYMQPTPALKNTLKYYKNIQWSYRFLRRVFPKYVSSLAELGQAMIAVSLNGYENSQLEVVDIVSLAESLKK